MTQSSFQSTFPRGERQQNRSSLQRATTFQSTFPRGERHDASDLTAEILEFQSTFPRGERRWSGELLPSIIVISIHVPAWGTTERWFGVARTATFQSTFPRGERRKIPMHLWLLWYFNPRSRVGNDAEVSEDVIVMRDFNPRSRVGNDNQELGNHDEENISIHVPAWGTTTFKQ